MHATYFFLVNMDLSFGEGSALEQAEDRFLSYASNWCDDNNYWEIEGVVTNGHQTFGSIKPPSYGKAWDMTWDLAVQAVASEFPGDIDPEFSLADKSRKAIINWMNAKFPVFLSSMYQNAVGNDPQAGANIDSYIRCRLSRSYELFQRVHECDRAPFTRRLAVPYDYRAFDLTDGEYGNAVILVDIHT